VELMYTFDTIISNTVKFCFTALSIKMQTTTIVAIEE
jgi:hypothetical protein